MRIRTILKAAAVPAIITGGLLATSAGSAAHAATLTASVSSPASNGQAGHMTGKDAAFYQDGTFGWVKVNETQHQKFDTVSATFTDATGTPTPRPELAGQTFSYGWNSDFGTTDGSPTSIHPATGTLTGTVNADGTGYTAQATYPPAS
jgi:hypothetical protein